MGTDPHAKSDNHRNFYTELDRLIELGYSKRLANDVLYFRTLPQHTAALEAEFVALSQRGMDIDTRSFGL